MTSSAPHHFESCTLRALNSQDAVLLSSCWRHERIKMKHHGDGKVDLVLSCPLAQCLCAQALKKSKACKAAPPADPLKTYHP